MDGNDVSIVLRRSPLKMTLKVPTNAQDSIQTSTLNNEEKRSLSQDRCCISCLCKQNARRLYTYTIVNEPLQRIFKTDSITLCFICRKLASRADKFVSSVQNNQKYLLGAACEVSDTQNIKPNFKPFVELMAKYLNTNDLFIKFDENPHERSPQQPIDALDTQSCMESQVKQKILDTNKADALRNSSTSDNNYTADSNSELTLLGITIKVEKVSDHEQTDNTANNIDVPIDLLQNSVYPKSALIPSQSRKEVSTAEKKSEEVKSTLKKHKIVKAEDTSNQNKDGEEKDYLNLPQRTRIKSKKADGNGNLVADTKKRNEAYQIIRISKEQSVEEWAQSAKATKYLEAPFKCPDCVKGYIMKNLYEEHMLLHDESRGEFSCGICKLRYASTKAVCLHVKKHFMRFKCRACDFVRKNACSVIEHFQKEHRKKTNDCAICGKALATKKSLKRHMKFVHTGVRNRLKCEFCSKTFKCKSILKNHLANMHTELVSTAGFDIKRYKCAHCPRGFAVPSKLKRHVMQKHTEFPDYYCAQCEKYFRTKDSLKNHEKTDPGHVYKHKKPFQCDYCGRRFGRKLDVKNHIVSSHIKRQLVQCSLCDKLCRGVAGVAFHIRAVHGQGITRTPKVKALYCCNLCGKSFMGEKWLNNHMRKIHDADVGAEENETLHPADLVETEYGVDDS